MNKFFAVILLAGACALPFGVMAKAATVEADATAVLSPEVEVVTGAVPPSLGVAATGREGELRLSLNVDGDPADTQYAVREASTGRYVDPLSGELQAAAVWGVYADWGGNQGVVAMVGSVKNPAFIGLAKNSAGEIASSAPVSLGGNYRASRNTAEVVTEAIMYGLGILVFAGLAVYQFMRMRKGHKAKNASRRRK